MCVCIYSYQYFIGFGNMYKYTYESHLRMLVLLVTQRASDVVATLKCN